MNQLERIAKLRSQLAKADAPALVVTHLADVRYLSGFTGSNAAFAVAGREARLFTDGRYAEQAQAEVKGAKVEIVAGAPAVAALKWLSKLKGVTYASFDATRTTVAELDRWRNELPKSRQARFLKPLAEPFVAPLRTVKDADEIARMEAAAALGCRLFDHILGVLRPGVAEVEVAAELEYKARLWGAEAMSFETIVAAGARSALPHGRATTARLSRRGFVVMDFGVVLGGYCSDMTRTVHLGSPTHEERKVYETVLEAQLAGVAAIGAGVAAGDVDEAARRILRAAGLDEAFTHSTGHGVGIEIHEAPRLGKEQKEKLRKGMVVTVEPGVYLAGRFGIRIEDMVEVTATGARILTPSPKALIEL